MMRRKLKDSAVVITGASSGIGRAAALAFANAGASLVLAARRDEPLQEAADECTRAGSRAVAVPTDVSDQPQVEALARQALAQFGRIDVWVNNAAVTMFGRFEDAPLEDYRRVIETNLFGYIYGARAALPYMREQGSGVLINVSSIVAKVPQPYVSAYVISKAGIRSLSMCLRQELALESGHDIHVCTVLPATIDTPFFQQGANYLGRRPRAMPPVYPAQQVAAALVALARKPRREVFVGNAGRMLDLQEKLSPGLTERTMATMVDRQHFEDTPAPASPGNLFEPDMEHTGISGGWREQGNGGSSMTRGLALLAPAAVIAWWLLRQPREEGDRGASAQRPARPEGTGDAALAAGA
jgi:NAD(P)-dependent dehydrogenase (short-subunit alcohol dehydrogenase family)